MFAVSAIAQEEQDPAVEEVLEPGLEEVQVFGIRQSLENAINKKRLSDGILDSISAEDIGQLPDENLADAMQRIAGVQVHRDPEGQGTEMYLRGQAVETITLEGSELAAGNDRAFNFADLSADMFSSIEVLKTGRADQPSGSLGGTVNLTTRKPLELKQDVSFAVNLNQKWSEAHEEWNPQGNMQFGYKQDTENGGAYGVIVDASYRETQTRGDTAWLHWQGLVDANIDADGDGVVAEGGERVILPRRIEYAQRRTEQETLSFGTTFQWSPSDNLDFDVQLRYTDRDTLRNTKQLRIDSDARGGGTRSQLDESYENYTFSDEVQHEILEDGTTVPWYIMHRGAFEQVSNIYFQGSPSYQLENQKTYFGAFNTRYEGDGWWVNAKLSRSVSDREQARAQQSMHLKGPEDQEFGFEFDIVNDPDLPELLLRNNVAGPDDPQYLDPANPNNPNLYGRYQRLDWTANENTKDELKLDFKKTLDFGPIESVKMGLQLANNVVDRKRGDRAEYTFTSTANKPHTGPRLGEAAFDECIEINGDDNFFKDASGINVTHWVAPSCTPDQVMALYGDRTINSKWKDGPMEGEFRTFADLLAPRSNALDKVTEENTDAYIMADLEQDIAGLRMTGNVGVRISMQTRTTEGFRLARDESGEVITDENGINTYADFKRELDRPDLITPSMNLNFHLTDDVILRTSAYKAAKRPSLNDVRPSVNVYAEPRTDAEGLEYQIQVGNPELEPVVSYNYDVSAEWYYAKGSMFSFAYFYKDRRNKTEFQVDPDGTIEGLIVPGSVLNPDGSEDIVAVEARGIRQKVNVENKFLDHWGQEITWTHSFHHLPGLFGNTGFNFNYTHVEHKRDPEEMTFTGHIVAQDTTTSPNTANLALYYEDDKFNLRVAYNWREEYSARNNEGIRVSNVKGKSGGTNLRTEAYRDMRELLDISAKYNFTDSLKGSLQLTNVTGKLDKSYTHSKKMARFRSWSGMNVVVGLNYKF